MLQPVDDKANVAETMAETFVDTKKRLLTNEKEMVCTSDEIIEKLSRNRSWKFNVYLVCLMINTSKGPSVVYLTSFAGNNKQVEQRSYYFEIT